MSDCAKKVTACELDQKVMTCEAHGASVKVVFNSREHGGCPLCYQQQKSDLLFNTLLEIKNKVSHDTEILQNIT